MNCLSALPSAGGMGKISFYLQKQSNAPCGVHIPEIGGCLDAPCSGINIDIINDSKLTYKDRATLGWKHEDDNSLNNKACYYCNDSSTLSCEYCERCVTIPISFKKPINFAIILPSQNPMGSPSLSQTIKGE
eukprot:10337212-Ditylum_brightwellii.AAC.1